MVDVLQIGNRSVTSDELPALLAGYQMLPQLVQELLIDQAIAPITCAEEELVGARDQFYAQNQITDEASRQQWLTRHGMTLTQLDTLATRSLRIEKFKEATWGPKLESYFLERKGKLDKVIYSLIRTQDMGIAQEIYFRVQEGEQTFAELARTYSKGPEAQTDGLIGPVELSVPHPQLAHMLSISQPGQLWPPHRIGEWIVIIRLEKFIPAQLDESMRRRLLNESFNLWLQQQLEQVSLTDVSPAPAEVAALPSSAAAIAPAAQEPAPHDADTHQSLNSEPSSTPNSAVEAVAHAAITVPPTLQLTAPDPTSLKPTSISSSPAAAASPAPAVAPTVES